MFGDSIVFNLKIPGEPETGHTFYNEMAKEDQIPFAFPAIQQYWIGDMFDASEHSGRQPARNWPTCGGFFDVARLGKRLGELDAEMGRETFWNNRDQAQKLIDEAGSLRKKIDPLLAAEKQLEDFRVMIELADGEPEVEQLKHLRELDRDFAR